MLPIVPKSITAHSCSVDAPGRIRHMGHRHSASPFLEKVRSAIRVRHFSIRTEDAYLGWIKRFILFHGKRDPGQMGESEVGVFLTDLAVERRVAASTQNQARSALLFFYREVLGIDLWLGDLASGRPRDVFEQSGQGSFSPRPVRRGSVVCADGPVPRPGRPPERRVRGWRRSPAPGRGCGAGAAGRGR